MKPCKRFNAMLTACGMLVCIPAYSATDGPIQPYVSYNFMWDSNIFRLSGKDVARKQLGSERMSTAAHRLVAGIDSNIPVSRQEFDVRINVSKNIYDNFRFLNYIGHDVLTRWDWKIGRRWAGHLGYTNRRVLAGYSQFQAPLQNIVSHSRSFLDSDYGLYLHWHLRGALSRQTLSYSADTQHTNNVTLDSAKGGIAFVSAAGNILELQTTGRTGTYPNRQVFATSQVDNSYKQIELSAIARWFYSASTALDARFGYVTRTYRELSVRNYNGLVGQVHLRWNMTGATTLHLSGWRRISAYQNLISSYLVSTGASISPEWTATPKITIKGRLSYETLSYQGDPGFLLNQQKVRDDTLQGAELQVKYTPFQKVTLEASYQWEYRRSNYSINSYRDNLLSAGIRLDFL